MKGNEGFTLVELLVSIVAGALVTFAAVSLLLLGVRVQHGSTTDVEEQQAVRAVLTLLEELAAEGELAVVRTTADGWALLDSDNAVRFTYAVPEQTLYSGTADTGAPLLTVLQNAAVTVEGQLLCLELETARGEAYATKVYCRTKVTVE